MKKFLDYVDEAQKKLEMGDAAFSKHIGGEKNRSLVSSWKNDGKTPDDYYCIVIAEILDIDPLEVIAAANYARSKDDERKSWWENFRKQYVGKTVVGVLLAICCWVGAGITAGSLQAETAAAVFRDRLLRIMYIMSSYLNVHLVYLDPDRHFALAILSPDNRGFFFGCHHAQIPASRVQASSGSVRIFV